jgi:hypothetical protein
LGFVWRKHPTHAICKKKKTGTSIISSLSPRSHHFPEPDWILVFEEYRIFELVCVGGIKKRAGMF